MTVVMKCRTTDTGVNQRILWRAPLTESYPNKIYDEGRIANEWSDISYVNNSFSGQYDLVINSTMSAGTQYVCQKGPFGYLNSNLFGIAELVVLGKCIFIIEVINCNIVFLTEARFLQITL